MTTSTKELIEQSTVLAGALRRAHLNVPAQSLENAAQRLREQDETIKQQINDYGRGMAIADMAAVNGSKELLTSAITLDMVTDDVVAAYDELGFNAITDRQNIVAAVNAYLRVKNNVLP